MTRFSYRLIGICFAVVLFLSLLNKYALHNALSGGIVGLMGKPGAFIFERSSMTRNLIAELRNGRDLAKENARLRQENSELVSRIGKEESLQRENEFLRRSLRLPPKGIQPAMSAGIFVIDFNPSGYTALINRGKNHGVTEGQIVVSDSGVLIGRVKDANSTFSRVQLVNDPSVEISVQVMGRETMGITKGNLENGLALNLVVQEDEISEGDTVISNGHDSFPQGLIVGRVAHVDANESDVFKKVRIDPAMKSIPLGPVLLLKP